MGLAFFAGGGIYWVCWYIVAPLIGRYTLEAKKATMSDGTVHTVWEKFPREAKNTDPA